MEHCKSIKKNEIGSLLIWCDIQIILCHFLTVDDFSDKDNDNW